ncbi:type II toxin-antitoxin system VapC family toxin [bacterium]|nr:type II toxin-antitoxin system VapC family toxin [bacterium]
MGIAATLAGERVYLDTNLFIHAVEAVSPYADMMREVFEGIDAGGFEAATSELTLAEVMVRPVADGNVALQQAYEGMIHAGGALQVAAVDRAILLNAARLRAAAMALKLPDAIHVATAHACRCTVLLTNDQALSGLSDIRVLLCSNLLRP